MRAHRTAASANHLPQLGPSWLPVNDRSGPYAAIRSLDPDATLNPSDATLNPRSRHGDIKGSALLRNWRTAPRAWRRVRLCGSPRRLVPAPPAVARNGLSATPKWKT